MVKITGWAASSGTNFEVGVADTHEEAAKLVLAIDAMYFAWKAAGKPPLVVAECFARWAENRERDNGLDIFARTEANTDDADLKWNFLLMEWESGE